MSKILKNSFLGMAIASIILLPALGFAQVTVPDYPASNTEAVLDEVSDTLGDSLLVLWTFIVRWGIPILLVISIIGLAFFWFRRR